MKKSFKLTTDTEFYMARNWIKCDKDALHILHSSDSQSCKFGLRCRQCLNMSNL